MSKTKAYIPKRFQQMYRGKSCLNCGHLQTEDDLYCSHCGQRNSVKKLSLKDLIEEFFSSFISYDSKLIVSLKTLLFKPGKMTKNFIEGQRQRYVNPFRLFLSSAIVFFLASALLTTGEVDDFIKIQEQNEGIVISDDDRSTFNKFKNDPIPTYEEWAKEQKLTVTNANLLNYRLETALRRIFKNPSAFMSFLFAKLPFIIFFIIPIFALFSWVFFSIKRFKFVDHLIFHYHLASFLLILGLPVFLVSHYTEWSLQMPLVLVFSIYSVLAIRNFFQNSWFLSLLKFFTLSFIFSILFVLFSILSLLVLLFFYA